MNYQRVFNNQEFEDIDPIANVYAIFPELEEYAKEGCLNYYFVGINYTDRDCTVLFFHEECGEWYAVMVYPSKMYFCNVSDIMDIKRIDDFKPIFITGITPPMLLGTRLLYQKLEIEESVCNSVISQAIRYATIDPIGHCVFEKNLSAFPKKQKKSTRRLH